jgi:hypothetical protein
MISNIHKTSLALLIGSLLLTSSCASSFKIRVSEESPPVFHLSGHAALLSFKVSTRSGPPVWEIYGPKGHKPVSEVSPIKFGEIPPGCSQDIPSIGSPPPLTEGEVYNAVGIVTDSPPASIRFKISNGRVLTLTEGNN